MKSNINPPRFRNSLAASVQLLFSLLWLTPAPMGAQTQPTQATTVPLMLPAGLA